MKESKTIYKSQTNNRMKKTILITSIATTVLTFTSCMKEPMACVDSTTKTGTAGQSVSFDASCSMDAEHYTWEFGDGATGEGDKVTHTYNTAGTYTAKVKAMSKDMKKENEKSITVTVN